MSRPAGSGGKRPRVGTNGGDVPKRDGRVADRVIDRMMGHIRLNRLAAGSTLPAEIQLSESLRVSRGIVREAYRSLSAIGIIDIANGRSPRVGRMTSAALARFLEHAATTQQATAAQIFELRRPIEERAAELSAGHRTDADIEALRKAVAAMGRPRASRESYVRADLQFHEIVGRATGNPLFAVIGEALREATNASIRASLASRRSRSELKPVVATHARIVDAIEAGRGDEARRLMGIHFDEAAAPIRRLPESPRKSRRRKR